MRGLMTVGVLGLLELDCGPVSRSRTSEPALVGAQAAFELHRPRRARSAPTPTRQTKRLHATAALTTPTLEVPAVSVNQTSLWLLLSLCVLEEDADPTPPLASGSRSSTSSASSSSPSSSSSSSSSPSPPSLSSRTSKPLASRSVACSTATMISASCSTRVAATASTSSSAASTEKVTTTLPALTSWMRTSSGSTSSASATADSNFVRKWAPSAQASSAPDRPMDARIRHRDGPEPRVRFPVSSSVASASPRGAEKRPPRRKRTSMLS
mmetsp:Transcript_8669/g.25594  ORF Transcript_8669/g.25594 Transcript_8669/m.25594 type:complete len:268 (-) Transcript_8669:312-1115(-)